MIRGEWAIYAYARFSLWLGPMQCPMAELNVRLMEIRILLFEGE
jgi:hypothetical protein